MLTRQLNSPDLDGFIGKAAFFLGLEMHHAPLDVDIAVVVAVEFRVSSQRCHECCGAGAEELKCVVGVVCEQVQDAGEAEVEEGPLCSSFPFCEKGTQPEPEPAHCSFCLDSTTRFKKQALFLQGDLRFFDGLYCL